MKKAIPGHIIKSKGLKLKKGVDLARRKRITSVCMQGCFDLFDGGLLIRNYGGQITVEQHLKELKEK
jgi:hypothetical protein